MAADLSIHIMTPDITEADFECFFRSSLGTKYFSWGNEKCEYDRKKDEDYSKTLDQLYKEFPKAKKEKNFNENKKYSSRWNELLQEHYKRFPFGCPHDQRISNSPHVWIGEVSWLKASLFDDADSFIPSPVGKVSGIINEGNEHPKITAALIKKVEAAFESVNTTGYNIAKVEDVVEFLKLHKGKRCFIVSW